MIAEAIDKIIEMCEPHMEQTDGVTYSDKRLYPVEQSIRADSIETHTLSSIVNYIERFMEQDGVNRSEFMIHIVDHNRVRLISCLDFDRKREVLIEAVAALPLISFGRFYENESFVIALQSMFVDDPDTQKAAVMRFAGTVSAGTIKEYGDDGITQKATVKTGITIKDEKVVPSPCDLRPIRTFVEVEQPKSRFVFRMRESNGKVESALFEADGGAWKLQAMKNIEKYFNDKVGGKIAVIM